MTMMKRLAALVLALAMLLTLAACGGDNTDGNDAQSGGSTLVYGSGDYTRINPAMDEHGEINVLLFDGLTDHDGDGQVTPRLAERWDYDPDTLTYTFYLAQGVTWHDGQPFTAEDVKFTYEAIMDPDNGSENAPNYEDVTDITVIDDHTVSFTLSAVNTAFLEYMTMAILPQHLLEGEDMQTSDFFRAPVGTGPYKLESWDGPVHYAGEESRLFRGSGQHRHHRVQDRHRFQRQGHAAANRRAGSGAGDPQGRRVL